MGAYTLFLFIAYIIWLLDIARLFAYSKRPLLYFFSHINENFIGRARRVQIKSVVLLLHVAGLLRNKHTKQTFSIRLKRLTSAGVSISCESCFTCAYVRSHSITTHRINVTAVRAGRAFVDIYIQTLKAGSLHTYIIFIMLTLEFWSSL